MKPKQRLLWTVLVFAVAGAAFGLIWVSVGPSSSRRDPLFHGQPESYWVTNVAYTPSDEEIKRWQEFGSDGVRVLIRGLQKANHPTERAYREVYRRIASRLPRALVRLLPNPKTDSTSGTRMCLVSLLCRLGSEADLAEPIMARTLRDETPGVRQLAINFFTWGENEKARLNQLDPKEKRRLLPDFIRALEEQRSGNWGLRNNATVALRYYPEQREVVAPVLVKTLQDPVPMVRLMAARALNQVDPETSKKAGAISVVLPILKDPNHTVACRVVELLGQMKNEADLAVPALIQVLENTNTLLACQAVWAFEWGEQFDKYTNVVVPALNRAAQRQDNVSGYAKAALKRFESRAPTTDK